VADRLDRDALRVPVAGQGFVSGRHRRAYAGTRR
jgi:hypothetical protein